MNRHFYRIPLLLTLALTLNTGCGKKEEIGGPVAVKSGALTPAQAAPAPPQTPAISQTPLKDALDALFEKESASADSPFPKGTHLLNVNLANKVASLDVSKEFNGVLQKGESTEAAAQKKLCATLAKFPEVDKMRLTVEGKSFDSQATDWGTAFPVRAAQQPEQVGSGAGVTGVGGQ